MAFRTNRIEIDGSLNVDGSIYQFNELFNPGGASLEYVDGSLAIRDGSIGNLYISKTDKTLFDSSIAYLTDNTYTKSIIDSSFMSIDTDQTIVGDKSFAGIIYVDQGFCHTGDTDTCVVFDTNNIEFFAGNATYNKIALSSSSVVINEDSQDYDFRVESDGNANMLFVDGGTNRVGIGTATPDASLTIIGDVSVSGNVITEGRKSISSLWSYSGNSLTIVNSDASTTMVTMAHTNAEYEADAPGKIYRVSLSGTWSSYTNTNVYIKILLGNISLVSQTIDLNTGQFFKTVIEFGPKDGTTTFGNYHYLKSTGTSYYTDIGAGGVAHGTGSDLKILIQLGLNSGTFTLMNGECEIIKN